MKKILFLVLTMVMAMGCSQEKVSSKPITQVTPDELKEVYLVDVRTPEEYAAGHLDNSVNIDWYDADFATKFSGVDKDKTIYVYCKMGGRSAQAQQKLKALGYANVVNLEGGYDAWRSKQ